MNIVSYHMGNGLVVCDKDTIDSNTNYYLVIAFIQPNRDIIFYKRMLDIHYSQVIHIAKTDNRNISITEDTKVFSCLPDNNMIVNIQYEFK